MSKQKRRFAIRRDYLDRAIVIYLIVRHGAMTRSELVHVCRKCKGLTSERADKAISDLVEMGILHVESDNV